MDLSICIYCNSQMEFDPETGQYYCPNNCDPAKLYAEMEQMMYTSTITVPPPPPTITIPDFIKVHVQLLREGEFLSNIYIPSDSSKFNTKLIQLVANPIIEENYNNWCWSCKANTIDSKVCTRDKVWIFGFNCPACGKSLRESFFTREILNKSLRYLPFQFDHNMISFLKLLPKH